MTKIADKVRTAEAELKKKRGIKAQGKRLEELKKTKLQNQKKQRKRAEKSLKRKIARNRAKG